MDFGLEKLEDFDVMIFNLAENKSSYVESLIDAVPLQRKEYLAVLLLLNTDEEMRRVIAKLDYWVTSSVEEQNKRRTLNVFQI